MSVEVARRTEVPLEPRVSGHERDPPALELGRRCPSVRVREGPLEQVVDEQRALTLQRSHVLGEVPRGWDRVTGRVRPAALVGEREVERGDGHGRDGEHAHESDRRRRGGSTGESAAERHCDGEEDEGPEWPQPAERVRSHLAERRHRSSPGCDQPDCQRHRGRRESARRHAIVASVCVPPAPHEHGGQDPQRQDGADERRSIPAGDEGVLHRRPKPPRRQGDDGGDHSRAEVEADRVGGAAGTVDQPGDVPATVRRELLDERLDPTQRQHRSSRRGVPERSPAPATPNAGLLAALAPEREREAEHPPCPEQRDQEDIAQVRLHDEAADAGREGERQQVAARHRPDEHEEEQEREQHRVWAPRIEQQLAAHGPAQRGRGRHGDGSDQRAAPPVREQRDADDAQRVDESRTERDPGAGLEETRRHCEHVEVQRTGVIDQCLHAERNRRPRSDQGQMREGENVAGPNRPQRVVLGREPAVLDRARGRDRHRNERDDHRREEHAGREARGGRRGRPLVARADRSAGLRLRALGDVLDAGAGRRAGVHVTPRPRVGR